MTILERFWAKVLKTPEGCWEWQGGTYHNGYGEFCVKGRSQRAHRFAYEYFVGPIPSRMQIDHLCRNRKCVNPDHLEAVPQRENTLRGTSPVAENAQKTHCKRGHAFTPENTYVRSGPTGRPWRVCRACRAAPVGASK